MLDADQQDAGQPPDRARPRFAVVALLAIGLVAAASLGGFLLLSREDRRSPAGPSWSAWAPTADGAAGAAQIAAHVAPQYRSPRGGPLVRVEGGEVRLSGLPLTIALRGAGGEEQRYEDAAVLYRMCWPGRDCTTAAGLPSIERHLLLRREALELALLSLRYLDGVDQVAVLLPPRRGEQPSQALLFRRDRLSRELGKPLDATLVDRKPSVARVTKSPDALLVEQLTIPSLFRFSVTRAGRDGRGLRLLDPLNAPAPAPVPPPNGSGRSTASLGPGAPQRPAVPGASGSRRVNPGQAATGTRGYFG
jgi:hypothetical protein